MEDHTPSKHQGNLLYNISNHSHTGSNFIPQSWCDIMLYVLINELIIIDVYFNGFNRTGKSGSLEVNGFSFVRGESQGILKMLNTEGIIYIGKRQEFVKALAFEKTVYWFPKISLDVCFIANLKKERL